MKKASGIGKEWSEQANAFAEYVIGKTVDEVKGIAVNEEGRATGAELTGSVTISIADAIETIEKRLILQIIKGRESRPFSSKEKYHGKSFMRGISVFTYTRYIGLFE